MEKIKILHILTDTNIGGAGTLLINYLRCFDRNKYDISVCLPEGAALAPKVEAEGYRVIPLQHGHDKSFEMAAISEFIKLFKKEKPDIVHTHSAFSAKLAAFLGGVKSRIYTRHCTFDMPRKLTTFPGKQINGFVNNTLATQIIAVADSAKDNLTETGVSEKKITVIVNGVLPLRDVSEEEIAAKRAELKLSDGDFVCGIAARLEHYKGHAYLLDTVKEISETHPNIKVLIMGRGSEEDVLKAKAKALGIEDNVIFTGFITDLAPYYHVTDLCLNCSYGTEATSMALGEGMSLSIPAVVTSFGGNPYMVENDVNGYLVPIKDSHAMAEAIIRIMNDADLRLRLGEGARRMFEERFTAEAMTRKLERIYDAEAERIGKK